MAHAMRVKRRKPKNADDLPTVLTLREAATLLRLPSQRIAELVAERSLPGRQIDDDYRFLRSALEAWLRGEAVRPAISFAGALAADPYFPQILEDIAAERKRTNRKRS